MSLLQCSQGLDNVLYVPAGVELNILIIRATLLEQSSSFWYYCCFKITVNFVKRAFPQVKRQHLLQTAMY